MNDCIYARIFNIHGHSLRNNVSENSIVSIRLRRITLSIVAVNPKLMSTDPASLVKLAREARITDSNAFYVGLRS